MDSGQWRQRWQHWQSRRPRLHRDGVSLPASLLLDALQKQLNGERLQVENLQLHPEHSCLTLLLQQPVAARLQLFFHFGAINWPARTVLIHYQLQGSRHDGNLVRRTLGTLLLVALDAGLGTRLLQNLTADLDYIDIQPQHIHIHLDRLPPAARWLEQDILGKPLAERIALRAISTPEHHLRLSVGRQR